MFIITAKKVNSVVNYGLHLDYMSNGYPRLVDEDTAFLPSSFDVHETDLELPEDINKKPYCFTDEKGFYLEEEEVTDNGEV